MSKLPNYNTIKVKKPITLLMVKIASIFLGFIIIFTFLTSFLYYCFNLTDPLNPVNQNLRHYFLKSFFLRKNFKLYQIGDARFDYSRAEKFTSLKIVFFYQKGEALLPQTIENVVKEINGVVNKPEGILFEEKVISQNLPKLVTDEMLNQLITDYAVDWRSLKDQAVLQAFVLKQYSSQPSLAGLVQDAHNIFLFMQPIREVSDYKTSGVNVQTSTILHEFGHLLGAEHVQDESCIMSAKVENLAQGLPSYVRGTYCPADLEEIKKAFSN